MNTAKTTQIAQRIGVSERYARSLLVDLERRGLVKRVSQRGGWIVTDTGKCFVSPAPFQEGAAAAGADTATAGGLVVTLNKADYAMPPKACQVFVDHTTLDKLDSMIEEA